jgi:hypothetical protein
MTTDTVTRFLDAISAGTGIPADLFASDCLLDATVPMWRFEQHGPPRVAGQLSHWFADPATLSEVRRQPVDGGEVLQFTLAWTEDGTPMAAHQVHVLDLDDQGRIAHLQVWCGGRWEAGLLAEIEDGLQHARRAS